MEPDVIELTYDEALGQKCMEEHDWSDKDEDDSKGDEM